MMITTPDNRLDAVAHASAPFAALSVTFAGVAG